MSSDGLIRFIEDKYEELTEKFIEKNQEKWDDFVMSEYESNCADDGPHELEGR